MSSSHFFFTFQGLSVHAIYVTVAFPHVPKIIEGFHDTMVHDLENDRFNVSGLSFWHFSGLGNGVDGEAINSK